jgi:hypothetical protein
MTSEEWLTPLLPEEPMKLTPLDSHEPIIGVFRF